MSPAARPPMVRCPAEGCGKENDPLSGRTTCMYCGTGPLPDPPPPPKKGGKK